MNPLHYEGALIGATVAAGRLPSVAVSPADFSDHDNALIWQSVIRVNDNGDPVDIVRISDDVQIHHKDSGLFNHLMQLTDGLADPMSLNWYAGKVLSQSKIRSLKNVVASVLTDDTLEFREAAERIETALVSLAGGEWSGLRHIHSFASEHLQSLEHEGYGVMSGFQQVDRNLMGFKGGHYYIIGGRPSNGKTLLALEIAMNIAAENKVAYFLLETSGAQLASRAIALKSRMPSIKLLRRGASSQEEWAQIVRAADEMGESGFMLDESSDLSLGNLRPRLLAAKEMGCNVVIIDYLQLVESRGQSEREKANAVSASLRKLSKDLDIAVVGLCQLSRRAQYEKPSMGHLKESGNFEADADAILLVYRHAELPSSEKWFQEYASRVEELQMLGVFNPEEKEEIIWVEIAKNRQSGMLTTMPMVFKRRFGIMMEA